MEDQRGKPAVAVVTGASGALGERFTRCLHAQGAIVVVAARRVDRLERLRDELGERIHPVRCDVASGDERRDLIEGAIAAHGPIGVLVNNAGIGEVHRAEDEPLERFVHVLEVNLIAVFHLCQLAARSMLAAGRGNIVNVSSVLGLGASAPINQASYCTSKGGVVSLTRELAGQWARRGIRVNALAPGWFPTEMNAPLWENEWAAGFVRRNTPMGRPGSLEELDDAIRFLLSETNTFFTGQVLTVDGGWTAR